jgi:Zn-finger nucleic acid-binding protein
MRSYERNGVTVDQCTGCGGLFLDRGELEALASAESAFYAGGQPQPQAQPTAAAPQAPPPERYEEDRGRRDDRDRDYRDDRGGYKKKKKSKKSFLEDRFEMGG